MDQGYGHISDYAVIGNGQTAALVSRDGSIDWCCWPRFDSPAIFCRLLDSRRGGFFRVAPTVPYEASRAYSGLTNILETRFTTERGILRLTDLMPAPAEVHGERVFPHRILRRVECMEGRVEVDLAFRPTFDYAATKPRFELSSAGATAFGRDEALGLVCPFGLRLERVSLLARHILSAGEASWCILTHGPSSSAGELLNIDSTEAQEELERTERYWERWSGRCHYDGPYKQRVLRSALALKLLVFQPTGGLIAAPTTSLPAEIGGERNWDYRFTWLRDSGLVLDALQQLGYHDESMRFIDWLEQLSLSNDRLRVMYAVDGKMAPPERSIDHLTGYRDSQPVRVGNGAVNQTQIDTYGHILDAVILCYERMPRTIAPDLWRFLCEIANRAASAWPQRDHGPWEIRRPAEHYLYSKLYCWVGLDRAIRFAERHRLPGEIERWKRQRNRLRDVILSRGFHPQAQAFTQTFGNTELDAGSLTIATTGFLPASDERVRSTVRRIREQLASDGFVYRYVMDDGLPGRDASFSLCSFWLVSNLALAGDRAAARTLFERIVDCANDVGLLSEQINSETGELLGNFPQGFAHLGLIRAALHLRDGP